MITALSHVGGMDARAAKIINPPKLSIPEISPAETPSFDGYVTSAPSSKNNGVVAPRKAEAAQKRACIDPIVVS